MDSGVFNVLAAVLDAQAAIRRATRKASLSLITLSRRPSIYAYPVKRLLNLINDAPFVAPAPRQAPFGAARTDASSVGMLRPCILRCDRNLPETGIDLLRLLLTFHRAGHDGEGRLRHSCGHRLQAPDWSDHHSFRNRQG
jgi:hypothetical protein